MTYEEAIEKVAAEGAIRAYRLSDSTAYAYRLKGDHYEARTLVGIHGDWSLGKSHKPHDCWLQSLSGRG